MASPVSVGVIRFGEFEARLASRELYRNGARVRLPDQSFQILAALLERQGELVSREQIKQRLWPGDTFVDFDHGLNNAVNRLREALGDTADSPRFIETLPRRGYRFIGSTNGVPSITPGGTIAAIANRQSEDETIQALGASTTRSRGLWKYGRLLLVLSVGTVILFVTSRPHDSRTAPSRRSFVLPPEGTSFNLTGDTGGSVALSPDGSKLAFVAINAKGEAQIWVRPLGSLRAEAVVGSEGVTFPFWSPDSESLGFFADGKLKKINRHGGAPVTLCDAPFGRGGSWNRDGIIIFAPGSHSAIYRVADRGGTPEPITAVNSAIHTTHRWPKFLPDGKRFLYTAATHAPAGTNGRSGSHNGVYLSSLDGKENKFLIATDSDATFASGYLFFLQGDALMAQRFDPNRAELRGRAVPTIEKVLYDQSIWKVVFDASEEGVMAYETGDHVTGMQYRWYDRSGNEIGVLFDRERHLEPSFSPDGKKLADAIGMTKGDIRVHDLSRGVTTQITSDADQNSSPVWSRDDRWLFFACKAQHYSLCSVDVGGALPKQLVLDTGIDIWPTDLSPNGRFLLYGQGLYIGKARSQLWVYPLGRQSFRLLKSDAIEEDGQFSPDGHWVAYTSNQSGRNEVYVGEFLPSAPRAADSSAVGERWQVSTSGGHWPRWNRNGKELFYISNDNIVMAARMTKRGSTLKIGAARALFRASPDPTVGIPYDVSPDGKKFLINTVPPERAAPITLVENWLSDLKEN